MTRCLVKDLLLAVALGLQMILPTSQLPLSESVDEEEEEGEGEDGCYRRGHQPQSEVTDTSRDGVIPLVTDPLAARVTNPEAAATLGRGAEHGAAEDRQLPETSTNLQVFEGLNAMPGLSLTWNWNGICFGHPVYGHWPWLFTFF